MPEFTGPDLEGGRVETPPVAPPQDDDTKEPEASAFIEKDGVRYVRAEALREKNDKLKARTAELKTARVAAQQYEAVKPYLGLLATHPDLQHRQRDETGRDDVHQPRSRRREADDREIARGPRSARALPPVPEEEIAEFDEVLDSLGIEHDAGRKLVELVTHVADRRSARAVAPTANAVTRSVAAQARERMYKALHPQSGELYATREAIDEVLRKIPETMLHSDENISALLIQARGLGGPGGHVEPLHTEEVGRRGGARRSANGREPISDFERRLMGAHNIKDDEYAVLSDLSNFNLE